MIEEEKVKTRTTMRRDYLVTILAGPFKYIIPTLAYLFLYPIMLSRTSIEVVGVWSLLGSVVSFLGVADIGFSQLLTREAGLDRAHDHKEVYADYITAQRAYILILIALVAVFLLTKHLILSLIATTYPASALSLSILLILAGSILQLIGKLDAAILSARHDNYIIQVVSALTPLFTYSISIAGALIKRPIEGLALGVVVSGAVTIAVYRWRLRSHNWHAGQKRLLLRDSAVRFPDITRRGWYLYSSSIGLLARGPIYRFVIASTIGLQGAAVFDIAMRVTQTVRDLVTSGFSVLYPSFAYLHRTGERSGIIELIEISLMALLTIGTLLLGVLIGAAGPILTLWLGKFPGELAPAVTILAIWQMITLINVPFWYLLQATNQERVAAFSIWAHTFSILLVLLFSRLFSLTLVDLLLYWTLTSILTQALIYYHVHSKLRLLAEIIAKPRIIVLLVAGLLFSLATLKISITPLDLRHVVTYLTLASVAFFTGTLLIVAKPVYRFLKASRIGKMIIA